MIEDCLAGHQSGHIDQPCGEHAMTSCCIVYCKGMVYIILELEVVFLVVLYQ